MLTNTAFFDTAKFDHPTLLPDGAQVWESLISLKQYMNDYEYHVLPEAIKSGVPLTTPLIIYHNKWINSEETEIEYGDATKGALRVYQNGNLLDGASVIMAGAVILGNKISIGKGVKIEPGAFVQSPAIIGDFSEIRQGAYLRGYCLVGKRCVVGHVTEVKHSIFLDDAKAGHFAYVGDSILGNDVNLGAGTKLANLRFLRGNVQIRTATGSVSTGLRKLGAIMGDQAQTGCNAVTNPGTLLGKKAMVLPNTTAPSGYHPDSTIIR